MSAPLTDKYWNILIQAIQDSHCTPFLGAGVNSGLLPLGRDIALKWAKQYDYPLKDKDNLIRVAQFLAVDYFPMFPKEEVIRLLQQAAEKNGSRKVPPALDILADIPFSVYLTTNYDNLMFAALERNRRDPKREVCRWNTLTKAQPAMIPSGYEPSPANPLVFHLHGHLDVSASIVLSEDDYFDFLINSRDPSLLPKNIETALTNTLVLFLGYGLADWNFRVLLQGLSRFMEKGLGRQHIAVMLPPGKANSEVEKQKIQKYLTAYYHKIDVKVFFGTVQEFCEELGRRWHKSVQERIRNSGKSLGASRKRRSNSTGRGRS